MDDIIEMLLIFTLFYPILFGVGNIIHFIINHYFPFDE